MASPEITNYITQNLQLGYDINSIKNSLIQSGYTVQQVNAAIDYVSAQKSYGNGQKQTWNTESSANTVLKKKPFVLIGAILIILIVAGLVFILISDNTNTPPQQRPIQPIVPTEREITNIQPPKPQVTRPKISDPIEDFLIEEQPTTPIIQTPSANQQLTQRRSRLEIDEEVKRIAATNPDEALLLCGEIVTRAGTHTCVKEVAFRSENPAYCEGISDVSQKDKCYMNFAINERGSADLCNKVANDLKRKSCFTLYETLDALAEAEKLPPVSQELIDQANQNTPSQDIFEEAATTDAFGSTSAILEDEV